MMINYNDDSYSVYLIEVICLFVCLKKSHYFINFQPIALFLKL